MQMTRLSRKDVFNFYVIFDEGVAQWLTPRKDMSKNVEIFVVHEMQMAPLSRKDIFNFYAIFDDGIAQWLTQCRDTLKNIEIIVFYRMQISRLMSNNIVTCAQTKFTWPSRRCAQALKNR